MKCNYCHKEINRWRGHYCNGKGGTWQAPVAYESLSRPSDDDSGVTETVVNAVEAVIEAVVDTCSTPDTSTCDTTPDFGGGDFSGGGASGDF